MLLFLAGLDTVAAARSFSFWLEMQLALDEWHARIPDYGLAGDVGLYAGTVVGVTALPLRW